MKSENDIKRTGSESQQLSGEKKVYSSPRIEFHGSVTDFTAGALTGSGDGASGRRSL